MDKNEKITAHDFIAMCLAAYSAFLPIIGGIAIAMLAVYGLVMLL